MPRPIDQTFLDCSALSQPEAIALHSSGGEGRECWDVGFLVKAFIPRCCELKGCWPGPDKEGTATDSVRES